MPTINDYRVQQCREHIGCKALWFPWQDKGGPQLHFPMRVKDVRERCGRIDYLVEPIGPDAGGGSRWIWESKLDIQP